MSPAKRPEPVPTPPAPGTRPPRTAVLMACFDAPPDTGRGTERHGALAQKIVATFQAGHTVAETADMEYASLEDVEATLRANLGPSQEELDALNEKLDEVKSEVEAADEAREEAEAKLDKEKDETRAYVEALESVVSAAEQLDVACGAADLGEDFAPAGPAPNSELRQVAQKVCDQLQAATKLLYFEHEVEKDADRVGWLLAQALAHVKLLEERAKRRRWLTDGEVQAAKQGAEKARGTLIAFCRTVAPQPSPPPRKRPSRKKTPATPEGGAQNP